MRSPPKSVKLDRVSRSLEITWPDDAVATIAARRLRQECPCASCVDEFTGRRILDVDAVPLDIGVENAQIAGAYALKFTFTDGHDTGLFTWDRLFAIGAVRNGEG